LSAGDLLLICYTAFETMTRTAEYALINDDYFKSGQWLQQHILVASRILKELHTHLLQLEYCAGILLTS